MGDNTPNCPFAEFLTTQLVELKKTLTAEHLRLTAEREQQHNATLAKLQQELNSGLMAATLNDFDPPNDPVAGSVGPVGPAVQMKKMTLPTVHFEPDTFWDSEHSTPSHEDADRQEEKPGKIQRLSSRLSRSEFNEKSLRSRTVSVATPSSCVTLHDIGEILLAAQELDRDTMQCGSSGGSLTSVLLEKRKKLVEIFINPAVCLVLLANAFTIGLAMDVEPDWLGWIVIDGIFVSVYVFEMLMKWYFLGVHELFGGSGCGWNILDLLIVVISIVDVIVSIVLKDDDVMSSSSYMLIRLIRLSRFGRLLRLFEFDIFRELLTMLRGLVSGLRTLVWAFVLLIFPIYALGLALTSILGQRSDVLPTVASAVKNVPTSMFLVFRCSVGDCSLEDGTPAILALTREYGWVYGIVYVLTMMLVTFGIFNLIMATFVDNALSAARKNEQIRMKVRLTDTERQVSKTSQLVYKLWKRQQFELPEDEQCAEFAHESAVNCLITKDVFDETLADPDAQQLLEDLDVADEDRLGLFDVLDADGGGTLQLFELIRGLLKLRGEPRRSDVVQVGLMVRCLQERLDGHATSMDNQLLLLQERLDGLFTSSS